MMSKFQSSRICFQESQVTANFGGKVEQGEERKNVASLVTTVSAFPTMILST